MTATSLSSLPAGHVEVLLGSQVTALPAGLETFGGTTVSAQDFITAAEQDGLPAAELPPGSHRKHPRDRHAVGELHAFRRARPRQPPAR